MTVSYRVGIDVGGTFTDFVAVPDVDARVIRLKVASTPDDPSEAVEEGMARLIDVIGSAEAVSSLTHGTTIGLNAILQRKGGRVALAVSTGFPDILEIGRSRMPSSFDLHAESPRPLVSRDHVVEIPARLDPEGNPVDVPSDEAIDAVARQLLEIRPDSVVLSLVHGYGNPAFELDVASRLGEALSLHAQETPHVISAAAMWPEIREYERALVAIMGAHIHGTVQGYLRRLAERVRSLGVVAPLFISASNGGTLSLESAIERPLDTILSGPASGVTAARMHYPGENLITFDMGGTSSDISIVVGGSSKLTTSTEIGGLTLMLPVVDVSAIGAGGGSLIWADTSAAAPALQVGPDSAGASPGPASYGQGGHHPAITDAYLVAGFINADGFLGGQMQLFPDLASRALSEVATEVGDATEGNAARAAESALRLTTAQMGAELQKRLAERAEDARDFTIIPFGGAGPTHAAMLAEEIGVTRLRIPDAAATYCALGAALAPLRRDFVHSIRDILTEGTADRIRRVAADIIAEGQQWLEDNGDDRDTGTVQIVLDIRYPGQAYELNIALGSWPVGQIGDGRTVPVGSDDIQNAFDEEHSKRYGFINASSALSIGNLRVTVIGATTPLAPAAPASREASEAPVRGNRTIRWRGERLEAQVVDFDDIAPGSDVTAPAVIDHGDTTVVVPPGWRAHRLANADLELVKESAQ